MHRNFPHYSNRCSITPLQPRCKWHPCAYDDIAAPVGRLIKFKVQHDWRLEQNVCCQSKMLVRILFACYLMPFCTHKPNKNCCTQRIPSHRSNTQRSQQNDQPKSNQHDYASSITENNITNNAKCRAAEA